MGKFYFTQKALEDLTSIWNYTCDKWSENQADEYYQAIIASCNIIAKNPDLLGMRYDEIKEGLRGYKI